MCLFVISPTFTSDEVRTFDCVYASVQRKKICMCLEDR